MDRPKRVKGTSKKPSAAVKAIGKPKISNGKNSLSSLAVELQLGILDHLPLNSLPTICQLNKYWCSVSTDELLRRLLPISLRKTEQYEFTKGEDRLKRVIGHFIDTNNAGALQRLLDFRPKHPYFRPPTTSLLLAEPASLRAHISKDEEERFCLASHWNVSSCAVKAAFKFNDMLCIQLLIDHGLAHYRILLDEAVHDGFWDGRHPFGCFARPIPGQDSRGGHNSVLNWLISYPPRHVVQAMLIMWGRLSLHPRLQPLCDWCHRRSRYFSLSCDNMFIVAAGRGHPASLQAIDELRMMVEIVTDDAFGGVLPEARQPLSHALRIARGMASMWPGTPPLVAAYLQSVCMWEDDQSSSSGRGNSNNTNNPPPLPETPLILPPLSPFLHELIDLKTFDEMLEPENWQQLQQGVQGSELLWLVSTEYLTDEEAARRMRCFKRPLRGLHSMTWLTHSLLHAAGAFRRWHCVDVVVGALRGMWPSEWKHVRSPDVLCRAILDVVHGEPGGADGRIIRKLLRTGARNIDDFKGLGAGDGRLHDSPFRGGWFGWAPFRLAFGERQLALEQRETPACMEMRDIVLDCLSISDKMALSFLDSEHSKALYRASIRRRLQR